MSMGKPLPHDAAPLHVTGTARYVDDIPAPAGALHLAFGLSTVAHGRIVVDGPRRRCAPRRGWSRCSPLTTCPRCPTARRPPMTSRCWRWARCTTSASRCSSWWPKAISPRARRRGWARLHYEERPALLTVDEALAANSRFEAGPVVWARGDAAAAIAGAAHVVEGRMEVGGQEHFYLEGQVAMAVPLEGGDMLVHSSTQHPTEIQHKVAHALHLPMSAVRVEVRRMGGGFGGKESQGNALAIACALAARATGRPARMRYDRDDDMVITGKRHDLAILYRAGFDDEGRLVGRGVHPPHALRLVAGPVAAGGRPRDAACRQRLFPARRADREPPAEDQHAVGHGLPRLRRAAGDGRDRAGDGPHRAHAWAATRWRCGASISIAPQRRGRGAVCPPDPRGYFRTEEARCAGRVGRGGPDIARGERSGGWWRAAHGAAGRADHALPHAGRGFHRA